MIGHLKHVITAAEKMDVPFVNTFMGADAAKNQDDNWEEALRVWPDIVAFAKDHGRKITIENCPMLFSYDEWPGGHNLATTPRIWRRILEQWGGTIGLNFDPSHLILQMIDIPRFIREFGPHILHVQAKDLIIDREGLYERGMFSHGDGLADPAPARSRRCRVGASVRGPVAGRLRRRRDHRARGPRLREDRRPDQARLPASPATSSDRISSDDDVPTIDFDALTERDIAKAIDHSLLRPELDDAFVEDGCRLAAEYDVASVCVRPVDVIRSSALLRRHRRRRRHGHRLPPRQPADRDEGVRGAAGARADGATELDMVIQIGALKSGRDADVQADIAAVVEVAHAAGAIVKVIFENAYLTDDEKIRACQLSEAAGADFVKTSTGFAPGGATHDDLRLMRANTSPHIQVKAAGGVRTLDALLDVMALGVTRIGATATKTIIDDFRARKAGRAPAAVAGGAESGGSY